MDLYPYHQSVTIYLDGELTILVSCPYSNFTGRIMQTSLGERADLLYQILTKDILSYMTIGVLICMGVVMILISRLTNNILKGDGFFYMGLFSIVFCFWALAQLPLSELMINNRQGLLYMDYLNFFILGFCFFMYVRDRYQNTPRFIFGLISTCCLLLGMLGILGEFFFHYDFEDLLIYFHGLLVFGAVYAAFTMYRQQKSAPKVAKNITMNIGVISVMLSFIIDLVCYYFYQSTDVCRFSRIGLIVYDILLIYDVMRQYITAIRSNAEANFLKKIAYTDIMTNLENRRAYEMKIEELEKLIQSDDFSSPICIALCDLNHLKQINDNSGHANGDYYIITVSGIIKETFCRDAHCYRIGGDEFAIISICMEFDDFTQKLSTINQQLMRSHSPNGYQYSVAIGAKRYQPSLHKSI